MTTVWSCCSCCSNNPTTVNSTVEELSLQPRVSKSYLTLSLFIVDKSKFFTCTSRPRRQVFFRYSVLFIAPAPEAFFFSRAVGRFVVDCGPTDLRPKSRAARLDRNRKPRMNSLWHPSYFFYVLCAEEDCTFFPILLSVCVLCHKIEFLEMSMLQLLNRFKDTTERV